MHIALPAMHASRKSLEKSLRVRKQRVTLVLEFFLVRRVFRATVCLNPSKANARHCYTAEGMKSWKSVPSAPLGSNSPKHVACTVKKMRVVYQSQGHTVFSGCDLGNLKRVAHYLLAGAPVMISNWCLRVSFSDEKRICWEINWKNDSSWHEIRRRDIGDARPTFSKNLPDMQGANWTSLMSNLPIDMSREELSPVWKISTGLGLRNIVSIWREKDPAGGSIEKESFLHKSARWTSLMSDYSAWYAISIVEHRWCPIVFHWTAKSTVYRRKNAWRMCE